MTFGHELILKTKLQPPRLRRWTLARSRLANRLREAADYRLTLLCAPTGYGKSTLLASWVAQTGLPNAWYSLGQSDVDSLGFLLHLIHSFRPGFSQIGSAALELIAKEWNSATPAERVAVARQALRLFVNELCDRLTTDTFLIFDDFHWLENYPEVRGLVDELVNSMPAELHVVIAARQRPEFDSLARWQVQQEVLSLGKDTLAFTPTETLQLFKERYGYDLQEATATRLVAETEGWAIALQMVWQNLQGETAASLDQILADLPGNLSGLFDYLAQEVLNRQTEQTQRFLLEVAVLRRITGPACDATLQLPSGESEVQLRRLSETGLFLIVLGDGSYRYHHLFGEFLYSQLALNPTRTTALHERAALYYEKQADYEAALQQYLAASHWSAAASCLGRLGQAWIETGQLERLEHYLTAFPADVATPDYEPTLRLLHGDCLRLTSRFNAALHNYEKAISGFKQNSDLAGLANALRGRALVYLDTVQPAAAEEWLEQALELARQTDNRQLQGLLLRDIAENKLNRGRPWQAEELHKEARVLLQEPELGSSVSDVRILLRSGRILEAIVRLEQAHEDANELHRPTRSHRERLLVMSLLYSITGQGEQARACAEEGIQHARELHTPFTEAVACMRLGHALFVCGEYERALEAYRQAQAMGDKIKVRRLQAEGLMGLCLLHGRASGGNLAAAKLAGDEGVQVAQQAGDEWIEGCLHLALAAAHQRHNQSDIAHQQAQLALGLFQNCGDHYGQLVARAWAALATADSSELAQVRQECSRLGYNFLFDRPNFFGPQDWENSTGNLVFSAGEAASQPAMPLNSWFSAEKSVRKAAAGRLAIITLGGFSVYRPDGSEVLSRDWQRDKARQLFQLLVTRREKSLSKDQILEALWFNNDPSSAEASFKVALNALVRALEPDRSSRSQSTYIVRSGSGASLSYSLRFGPDLVWLDAAEFEQLISQANQPGENSLFFYEQALKLYQGDFLPGCLYEDWAASERERLLSLFLTTAERVAQAQADRGEWEACLATTRLILGRDNCWEEAYRLMMLAYWRQQNRTAALRAYEKCSVALAEELGISPMPNTLALYDQILQE